MSIRLPRFAVIVAGGRGLRMKTDTPKQLLLLSGRPVLMRSIDAFLAFDPDIKLIIVLASEFHQGWKALCLEHGFYQPFELVDGGPERSDSVRNGLNLVPDDAVVAIHDGVRPLVPVSLIGRAFLVAAEKGSAIPVVPIQDTIREIGPGGTSQVDRSRLFQVQTPQVFHAGRIKSAYRQSPGQTYTDDAAVWEAAGCSLEFIQGEKENFKITVESDLLLAARIIGSPSR